MSIKRAVCTALVALLAVANTVTTPALAQAQSKQPGPGQWLKIKPTDMPGVFSAELYRAEDPPLSDAFRRKFLAKLDEYCGGVAITVSDLLQLIPEANGGESLPYGQVNFRCQGA